MSVADFLAWTPPGGGRWELYAGVPVAMAPPSSVHGLLAATLTGLLFAALRSRSPCRPWSEAGVLSPTRDDSWYQADIVVSCEPARGDRHHAEAPLVVIEILSPSTEADDRTVKLPDYRRIASVQEILLVDSRTMFAEIHRRMADGRWQADLLTLAGERLVLESCGLDVALGEIYEGAVFDPSRP